ncbi:GPI inositol-deacylase PGAP1-like protein [Heracleum sosnowskyi]|uniref:GPI inositol-deacylase PGAP1-like protein n=1 Tax=Heracleum sosnowskyi TaxID=360622 RepID=A0AAD8J2W5_9APIA|nr:GPI inositol-deacylase PGAP1-like protein [Heracleum sosnowskyi]
MQSLCKSKVLSRGFYFQNTIRCLTNYASPQPSINLEPKTLASPPEYLSQQTRCKSYQTLRATPYGSYGYAGHSPYGYMGYTENQSPTFLTTGNPCLDFFFHVVPKTRRASIVERLESAWAHDPLTTLKLICNLRGVKGTGKSDKEGFYTAALWLHEKHHRNLACNVPAIASFGYLKDMLEILFRLVDGADAREKIRKDWKSKKKEESPYANWQSRYNVEPANKKKNARGRLKYKEGKEVQYLRSAVLSSEVRVKANEAKMKGESEKASIIRKETRLGRSKKFQELYESDVYFQFLYEKISSLFADMLKADMKFYNWGKKNRISLAAKWCPSLDSFYDKHTLICASIAKKVFPRDAYPEYEGIEDAHYEYRVRDRLRKQVLVPLREMLQLPEVYMSAQEWSSVAYNRVASVAMKKYTDIFQWHDKERFSKYLEDVKEGKEKIASGALLPHDITNSCFQSGAGGTVAELQWKRMVDDMVEKGKLSNSIAVCDVSGSMGGTPMDVAVALGLLVSELSEEPWKGQVITFSQNPQIHFIKGDSLLHKCSFIRRMDWGTNTDFQKVFDQILMVAVAEKLSQEQMIKRVFVFSDMEFDQASRTPWETDYQAIQRKFKENGYEKVPEIVFWNLRDSMATPVTAKQNGVAMLSGFSKNLLTIFLNRDGDINPELVMELAISGKEYQKLVLYDD